MEEVNILMNLLVQTKYFHWHTKNYAQHLATDSLYSNLNKHIDAFVECAIGRMDRKSVLSPFKIIYNKNLYDFIKETRNFLESKEYPSDLSNIRDEIVQDLNQCLYLFTLG